jgi:hypothetical protein
MANTEFKQQIREYENIMFGLMLYQETSPKWVRKLQKISYKNMKRRGEKALKQAKNMLSDIKQGKDVQDRIMCFEWPIIMDDMQFRIEVMLQCYEELYPERPRERSLSKEEIIALRNKAMDKL